MDSDEGQGSLDRPVDADDHAIGPDTASLTLVEYGSYACPRCRAANGEVDKICENLGERLRYVFRHRPLENNELARRAAELAECATSNDEF